MLITPEAAKYIFRKYSQESYFTHALQSLLPSPKCFRKHKSLACKYDSPKQLDNVALDIKKFVERTVTLAVKYVGLLFFTFVRYGCKENSEM